MLIALLGITSLFLVALSIMQRRKIHLLQHDKRAFRTLVENSPDHIIRYDHQGRRVYVSPSVARLWGVPEEELIGQSPADSPLLDSAQNQKVFEGIRSVFETGEMRVVEIVFTDQGGRARSYSMLLIPERDAKGQVQTVLGVNREITAIRDAERLVSNLVAQLPGFVFKFRKSADGHMSYPFASPRIEEFFGLRPEDVADSAAPLHAMTHPEDAPRVLQAILESARTLSPSHVEYRLLRPGYPERWMEVIANPEREANGDVLWYGIFLDITERKRLQDELADAQNFLDRIIDTVADPIFVKDRQHRWIHVNEAFCHFVGGTREELIGKSDFDFFPEQEARAFWQGDDVVFTSGKEFASEDEINGNKPGEKRYTFARKTMFIDAHGKPILVGVISDVTERKRLQDELADAQNFLDRIINATIDPIFVKDRQHRWILVNDAFCNLLGGTREELIGKSDFEIFPEQEARIFWEDEELVFTEGKEFSREEEFTNRDGEKRYVFTRKRIFKDVYGKPNLTGVVTDITERKRMELQLAARERELRSLMENLPANIARYTPGARNLYVNLMLERTLDTSRDDLLGRTPMEAFPDGHYSEYQRRILATAASGGSDEMEITVPNADGEMEYHMIRFVAEHDDKDSVTSVLVIGTDISERKRAEMKLATRERELRTLMENIPDNIVRYTPDARYLYTNPVLERTTGKRYEYLQGKTIMECFPDGRYAEIQQRVIATGASGSYDEMEMPVAMADGGEEVHLIRFIPERDDKGTVVSVLIIGTDITERRRAELVIATRERELRTLMENIPANISRYMPDARGIYANPSMERLMGSPADVMQGRTPMEVFPDGRFAEVERRILATAASGGRDIMEVVVPVADGEVEYHQVRFVAEHDDKDSVTSVLVIGTDISERKQAELALAARERELRTLMESIPDNIVRYTPDARHLYLNPVTERTTGKLNEYLQGKTITECFPDGRYAELERRVIATATSGDYDEMELLVQMANGEEEEHLIRFIPERDDKGAVVSVLIIGTDITERRRAEEKLRLAASVFTNTNEGIIVTDVDNRILDVNAAFTRITGYTREEAIGKNPNLLRSQRQDPEFYAELWRSLEQTGQWVGEIWNRRKNGEVYAERLTISVVRDEQGKLSHYVAVFADITLIKQQEQQLQRIAHHDALTGLPNRLLFMDRLKQSVAQARRSGSLIAVCYGDLDGFKPVNDHFGHETGDAVLVTIGERMQESVRAVDTVGRIGGDEFVILLMNLESAEECEMILTRLLDAVAQPIQLDGYSVSVTASLGVALFRQDDADPETLLRHADQAMYQAKQAGKSVCRFFEPEQT